MKKSQSTNPLCVDKPHGYSLWREVRHYKPGLLPSSVECSSSHWTEFVVLANLLSSHTQTEPEKSWTSQASTLGLETVFQLGPKVFGLSPLRVKIALQESTGFDSKLARVHKINILDESFFSAGLPSVASVSSYH